MKKSRFSDPEIAFALQQAETGSRLRMSAGSCGYPRRHYYRWKKHYGGLMPSEVRSAMEFMIWVLCIGPAKSLEIARMATI